ncbi:MAG: hypothetical protein QG633_345 [Patescibacteria group bacterium]|nr:hypothetical protein [Patescibacteria group bacterium]
MVRILWGVCNHFVHELEYGLLWVIRVWNGKVFLALCWGKDENQVSIKFSKMDLSINLENTTLYIRVAGLVKTSKGFLFEKSHKGYIYTVGGKIKLNESSEDAIKREVMEELGMRFEHFALRSVIENFFVKGTEKVHEICFVYDIEDLFEGPLPEGFIEVPIEDLDKHDIRPDVVTPLLKEGGDTIKHIIKK